MLEQSLEVVGKALNAANKAGVFTLQESAIIAQSFQNVFAACGTKQEVVESEVEPVKKTK